MKNIVQQDNSILRNIAREVPLSEIKTLKIQNLIRDMSDTLEKKKDGVAIAAPQVGVSLRIFIVSGKILGVASPAWE